MIGPKLHVLVAGEYPTALTIYRNALTTLGHTAFVATDTSEAIEIFRHHHPALVVADLCASSIDGGGICRHVRASLHGHETYVLVIAQADPETLSTAISETGADDFLVAPVTQEQLDARLRLTVRNIVQRNARRDAELALARAQWLAGIGETSLALQHEINNPLTAIIGNATLLESREYSYQQENEFIRTIIDQAHRIGDVVRRLALLRNPRSVAYVRGTKMLDLSPETSDRENRREK